MNTAVFKKIAVIVFILFSVTIANLSTLYAAGSINAHERENYRLQQLNEQERLSDKEKKRKQEIKQEKPDIKIPKPSYREEITGEEICFFIDKIILESPESENPNDPDLLKRRKESERLKAKAKKKIEPDYINRCITLNEINEIAEKFTMFYVESGYVTTRVKIPTKQNLKNGILKLLVIDGFIEKIFIKNPSPDEKINISGVFPFLNGKLLRLQDLEQGIEQINRLKSNHAAIELMPGKEEGGAKILIRSEPENRTGAEFSFANSGQKTTGEIIRTFTLNQDNPLGINDLLTFSFSQDNDDKRNKHFSRYYSLNYSFPFGYWTVLANYRHSEYKETVEGLSTFFERSGNNELASFQITRLLHRNRNTKTDISSGIIFKKQENYLEDAKLATGSRKLSVWETSIFHKRKIAEGTGIFGLVYSKGLKNFGAMEDPDNIPFDQPKAQFEKYGLVFNYYKPFLFSKQNIVYNLSLTSQYTEDMLYAIERIGLEKIIEENVKSFEPELLTC